MSIGTHPFPLSPQAIIHQCKQSLLDLSYGIVLWEIASRSRPFAGMLPQVVSIAVREGRRPDVPADCPEKLRLLMCQCWHQNEFLRPSFHKCWRF